MTAAAPTAFERMGGEGPLRAVIEDFCQRTFRDAMIGFMFRGKNQPRIIAMEYELAAQQLGAPVVYSGRPVGRAHRGVPVMGGHFNRRRQLLVNTLRDHGVADEVAAIWLEHVDGLRAAVLGEGVDGDHCDHSLQIDA